MTTKPVTQSDQCPNKVFNRAYKEERTWCAMALPSLRDAVCSMDWAGQAQLSILYADTRRQWKHRETGSATRSDEWVAGAPSPESDAVFVRCEIGSWWLGFGSGKPRGGTEVTTHTHAHMMVDNNPPNKIKGQSRCNTTTAVILSRWARY